MFPVNGFSGEYQREVGSVNGRQFWQLLVRHNVFAYLCSHILAFDAQVHDGVLQIVSAGAATAHRMPEENEYLHFVQAALDADGLRYQVVDQAGAVRESLSWPFSLAAPTGEAVPPSTTIDTVTTADARDSDVLAWEFSATAANDGDGRPQTLLAAGTDGHALTSIWIGLTGTSQRLTVTLAPQPGRSPHYWFGPDLAAGEGFDLQVALHTRMGPGGILWRHNDDSPWSSLTSYSPWGVERVEWPAQWTVGIDQTSSATAFRGHDLQVRPRRAGRQIDN